MNNKLDFFFQSDLFIKKEIVTNQPNEMDIYDPESLIKYTDNLFSLLNQLEIIFLKINKDFNYNYHDIITNTFKKYRQYIATELNKKEVTSWKSINTCLKDAIIVDLDATLAFNTSGRPFWGQGCAEGIPKDVIDIRMRELLHSICACSECSFIVLTGREDLPEIREATSSWLDINWLHPTELIMRPKGDVSKGDLCKFNLYNKFIKDKYNVLAVFEDSKKCVDMWRREGLLCLQPNSGLL